MRALGLDLGSKRIGVAVSSGTVASPLLTLQRAKRRGHDHERIAALVDDEEVAGRHERGEAAG